MQKNKTKDIFVEWVKFFMQKKKRRGYPHIIVFIIAILILVVSYFIRPSEISTQSFFYDTILNCGYIIITIVIVNGLWFILGGDPVENSIQDLTDSAHLLSDGVSTGMQRHFLSNANFLQSYIWSELLQGAKKHVDMMGYSLHAWTKNREIKRILVELAKRDVQIRIMVMDAKNPYFNAGLNFGLNSFTEQYMIDEVNFCSEFFSGICVELSDDKQKNVQMVKIVNGFVESQIIRIDNMMYITPYLYSLNTDDSPLFVLKSGDRKDAFAKYNMEFNMLWDMNKSVAIAEKPESSMVS